MSIALWKVVRTRSKVRLRGSKTRKPGAENPDPEDGQGASQAVGVSPRRYQDSPDALRLIGEVTSLIPAVIRTGRCASDMLEGEMLMLRLRDIMTRQVVTLEPQMNLREAMEILTSRHVSGAPVVTGQKVVGVLSAGDLLAFAAAPQREEERSAEPTLGEDWEEPAEWEDDEESESTSFFTDMWDEHTEDATDVMATQGETSTDVLSNHLVEEAMTKKIRWLSPNADVRSAADMMRQFGVHRVLVVNRGRLVGLVSAMDITKAVADRKLTNTTYVFDKKI